LRVEEWVIFNESVLTQDILCDAITAVKKDIFLKNVQKNHGKKNVSIVARRDTAAKNVQKAISLFVTFVAKVTICRAPVHKNLLVSVSIAIKKVI